MKPSRSGDIIFLVFKISMEAVKQPYCLVQNTIFILKILILLMHIFKIKFSKLGKFNKRGGRLFDKRVPNVIS